MVEVQPGPCTGVFIYICFERLFGVRGLACVNINCCQQERSNKPNEVINKVSALYVLLLFVQHMKRFVFVS